MNNNPEFWLILDRLLAVSTLVIDRPKGSQHPRYPEVIYPVDYGYLDNTTSMDGAGIDVFRGTDPDQRITAVFCTVDLVKRDSEIKLLIGCNEDEIQAAFHLLNDADFMKAILIRRP